MKEYHKKGQVAGSVNQMMMLIVGIGVGVMVLIFVGTLGGQTYNLVESDIEQIGNHSVINESFTPLNNTLAYFEHSDIHGATLSIQNSSGTVMGLGNFTLDYNAGSYILLGDAALNNSLNNTALKATYWWGNNSIQHSIRGGILSGFEALEQTGDYMPIIVLAVIIGLVLSLVLGMGLTGGGRGGSAL